MANSISMTTSASVASGHHVILTVACEGGFIVTSVSDNSASPLTWHVDKTISSSGASAPGQNAVSLCSAYAPSGLPSGTIITANLNGVATVALATADEVSGLITAGWVDKTTTSQGTGNPTAGSTGLTSTNNELIWGAFFVNPSSSGTSNTNWTAGTGYTQGSTLDIGASSPYGSLWTEYQVVQATGTYSVGAATSLSATLPYAGAAVTYKGATGTGTYTEITSPYTITGPLSVGPHTFKLYAQNASGVKSSINTYSWQINNTSPPSTPTFITAGGGTYTTLPVTVSWNASTGGTGTLSYRVSHDGGVTWVNPSGGPTATSDTYYYPNGAITFEVYCVDSVGSQSGTNTLSFSVEVPVTTPVITSPTNGSTVPGVVVTVTFNAVSGGTPPYTYQISYDGGKTWNAVSGSLSDTHTYTVGSQLVNVRASDSGIPMLTSNPASVQFTTTSAPPPPAPPPPPPPPPTPPPPPPPSPPPASPPPPPTTTNVINQIPDSFDNEDGFFNYDSA